MGTQEDYDNLLVQVILMLNVNSTMATEKTSSSLNTGRLRQFSKAFCSCGKSTASYTSFRRRFLLLQQEHAQEAKYANFRRRFLLFQLEHRNLRLFQGDFALALSRAQKDYINLPRSFSSCSKSTGSYNNFPRRFSSRSKNTGRLIQIPKKFFFFQ